jgi:hypothetical protein
MSNIFLFQVQLEHEGGPNEDGPWVVDIDHSTTKCDETEAVLIVATVTGEVSNTNVLLPCLIHSRKQGGNFSAKLPSVKTLSQFW